MNDEEEYEDDDENDVEYSPKSEFSKPTIVAEAIRETRKARGCEMREGYHNYKFSSNGDAVKVWIPDTRKVFISNVEGDMGLLSAEISRSERMKEVNATIKERKKALFEKYCYQERIRCEEKGVVGWKIKGEKWMPKIDEELPSVDPKHPKSKECSYEKGVWNTKVNRYWDEMLDLYDQIFAEINYLIDENNYFKQGARLS